MSKLPTRRQILGTLSGLLTAAGGAATAGGTAGDTGSGIDPAGSDEPAFSASTTAGRRSFSIMTGTEYETTVYERTASTDGPTVLVVGGIHGDEECGYLTADNVAAWAVDAGQLVVLPRANVVGIEENNRDAESGDLNRQFPTGSTPTSDLARAIWAVVAEYEPEVVVDLHQADGIYTPDQTAPEQEVGQAIFHSGDRAGTLATAMADAVNSSLVPDASQYAFLTSMIDFAAPPNGLLVEKAAQDLDVDSMLVEVTDKGLSLETQIAWQTGLVRTLLEGLVITADDGEDGDDGAEGEDDGEDDSEGGEGDGDEGAEGGEGSDTANDAPSATIETTPTSAAAVDFERGDTVTFDASASTDADGDVETFEWAIATDAFTEGDATASYTFDACGSIDATVRVTDDDGATDTATVTVSTADEN